MKSRCMAHLLVDISFHGFGHLSQTAPVINALAVRRPDLQITVRCAASTELLTQRLQCKFSHIPLALDFGMKMANAVDVLVPESMLSYREFHADWQEKVAREAEWMRTLQPDLLLANVPYLSLAAAKLAGVPAVALCSLDWADIFQHYCGAEEGAATIHRQMVEAYNSAGYFLQPQPAMRMPEFSNTRQINPIARLGKSQRERMVTRLPASGGAEKWILIAMGGMDFRLPVENWPRLPGVRWLVPATWNVVREDVSVFDSSGLSFQDVLASCDAVLTKPGYGTFTEAACCGVPVLYVSRQDWPEEPFLVQWLERNVACLEVTREVLQTGEWGELLLELWALPRYELPIAGGEKQVADLLEKLLA